MSDSGETELKARRPDIGEGRVDIIHVAAIDIAEKAQGDVKILRRHPACARQAATEQAQLPAQVIGQAQGNEEPHYTMPQIYATPGSRARRIAVRRSDNT